MQNICYWSTMITNEIKWTEDPRKKALDRFSSIVCTYQKTWLQCEQWNGRKSSRLHSAKLQCVPRERRSASSAMIERFSDWIESSCQSAVYIKFAESPWGSFGFIHIKKTIEDAHKIWKCSRSPVSHRHKKTFYLGREGWVGGNILSQLILRDDRWFVGYNSSSIFFEPNVRIN